MRGEFLPVWSETWRGIWGPLSKHSDAPSDLFSELYRELSESSAAPPTSERLADIVGDPARARRMFRGIKVFSIGGERDAVRFLERAHAIAADLGGDPLANRYYVLIEAFLAKFSLRYDLRRPFSLHPTLSGVFSRLMRELKDVAFADSDLQPLLRDFEDALRDLKATPSESKIKTCIQKQVNLLEALGQKCPGVTVNTLGQIGRQVGTWPHDQLREAMQNVYRFTCDYPGIRHAGTPASRIRDIEMKDMVSVTVLLAGFVPYLSHRHDADLVYLG